MDRQLEQRVLLVPPTRRDGEVTTALLLAAGVRSHVCGGLPQLNQELERGAGAILLTQEVIVGTAIEGLLQALARQPAWSDLPIILLMQGGAQAPAAAEVLPFLRNVTLLERPTATRTLISVVQAALRGRERQYEIRDHLAAMRAAEAESRRLQSQLEIAIDASELGTFHCEMPLGSIVWNERCKAHFWLPREAEVDFDLFYSILHPDDRDPVRQAITACVADGQPYDIEYRTVSPRGEIRWVRATGRTYYDTQQKPIRFDGTTQDITQRKRVEGQQQFLVGLDDAVRPLNDPVVITATAARLLGEYLEADRCAYADVEEDQDTFNLTGDHNRGVPSIVGRYAFSQFGQEALRLMRADQPYVVTDIDRHNPAPENLAPYRLTQIQAVVCVPLHKGGRLVAAMAVHQKQPRTWTRHEIELVELVASRCWESIERARINRNLQESEAKFRQLADSVPLIVWQARPDGTVDYFNERWYEFSGLDRNQVGEQSWDPILHPDDVEQAAATWSAAIRSGGRYQVEYRFKDRQSGDYRWFLGHALPVRDALGNIVRWFGTCIDIHDQKQSHEQRELLLASERAARSEAERAGRMKDEFLATLSHELRTPLNAILGYATLLRMATMSADEVASAVATIERNARLQAQLIEDLLDMNRIISGKVRLDVQRVELPAVIEAAADTVRPSAEAKQIRLRMLIDPLAGPVRGDPGRIQQVVWNLLSNAIKFTPKNGAVTVALGRMNSHVEITISDTGAGISQEFLPYVFDRFRQADASTTRRFGGLGLGLAIVKQLVELHGGSVAAYSGGDGAGATFVVALPTIAVHDVQDNQDRHHPRTHLESLANSSIDLTGVKVLAVDDEPDACSLVKRVLEECQADVETASSAAEALKLLQSNRFHVLVSDIGMPDEDGFQLIRQVRELAGYIREIPAVALTAFARSEDRRRAALAGFQTHLAKPVEAGELIAIVANLAGKASRPSSS